MWEWGHTIEGLTAHENLHNQDREWLEVCWAEIKAAQFVNYNWDFSETLYNRALEQAKQTNIPNSALANDIWQHASTENRTCTNGGWELYMCPLGCHTVRPDREEG